MARKKNARRADPVPKILFVSVMVALLAVFFVVLMTGLAAGVATAGGKNVDGLQDAVNKVIELAEL